MPKTVRNTPVKKKETPSAKKELKARSADLQTYGAALGDISITPKTGRFLLCFIRAILIFMACFGMLGGLVSSFGLSFNLPLVAASLFALSCLTAFLYYNKITFYLGYFAVFGSFIFFSVSLYWYINSGYQAFVNEVYNVYSDFFRLLSTREATEAIENRYLTVTIAMIFMGWFFCILLNISISGYMSLTATFLITFLPLQLAFYVDIVPPVPYLMLLLASYISVTLLGRSGHFTLPYRQENNADFLRLRRQKKHHHIYFASSRGMLQVAGYSITLSIVFLAVTASLFATDLNGRYTSNSVKNTTDRFIKAVLQGGIYSLFNRYNATGGLAQGQLGGIGNVNPDFQTDLVVRLVPNNSGNIYLHSYVGIHYMDNVFVDYCIRQSDNGQGYNSQLPGKQDEYLPRLAASHEVDMEKLYDDSNYVSKLWISNIDGGNNLFAPYFTIKTELGGNADSRSMVSSPVSPTTSEYHAKVNSAFSDELTMLDEKSTIDSYADATSTPIYNAECLYLPYENQLSYNPNPEITEEYQNFVYNTYLQIPSDLEQSLWDFCVESGLCEAGEYYSDTALSFVQPSNEDELAQYKESQARRLGIAAKLKRYFASEFEYTMSPGTTPRREDVVDYFLHDQRRGYCAHFASSSTLLLRRMGIPARYVEGYMISLSEILDGNPVSNSAEGWQSNADKLQNSGIVEVEVPDASAHAWVEIYLDGYGWIPYEFTPPSDEEPLVNPDLFSLFAGLFSQTGRNAANAQNNTQAVNLPNNGSSSLFLQYLKSFSFLLRPLLILLAGLCVILLLFPLTRRLRASLKLYQLQKNGHYSEALTMRYRLFIRKMQKKQRLTSEHPNIRDTYRRLIKDGVDGTPVSDEDALFLKQTAERAAFGKEEIDPTLYRHCSELLKQLHKSIRKPAKTGRKNKKKKEK